MANTPTRTTGMKTIPHLPQKARKTHMGGMMSRMATPPVHHSSGLVLMAWPESESKNRSLRAAASPLRCLPMASRIRRTKRHSPGAISVRSIGLGIAVTLASSIDAQIAGYAAKAPKQKAASDPECCGGYGEMRRHFHGAIVPAQQQEPAGAKAKHISSSDRPDQAVKLPRTRVPRIEGAVVAPHIVDFHEGPL